MSLLLFAPAMRPAALVLLAVFASACLALLPRELAFIRGAGRPWQARFILQDALIIFSILAVLLPSSLAEQLSQAALLFVLAGFTVLWIAVIWAAASRYGYVRQLLKAARDEGEARLLKAMQESAQAGEARAGEEDADGK